MIDDEMILDDPVVVVYQRINRLFLQV